jgi:cyanate permease
LCLIAGTVFDATGSYDNVFLGVVIGLVVAMFIAWSVQEKRFSGRYQIADTELTGAAAN